MKSNSLSILVICCVMMMTFSGCVMEQGTDKKVQIIGKNKGFSTINEAIAQAESGDVILVDSGIYIEQLSITKSITLKGEDTKTTIIKGNGSGDVISVTADSVRISNFTITESGDNIEEVHNAGIDIRSEDVVIDHINFTNNPNYGLYLYQSSNTTVHHCLFINNGVGGLYANNGYFNTFKQNTVNNNSIGFYLNNVYDSIIANNSFTKQDITTVDKGLYLYTSKRNIISDNSFTENTRGIHVKGAKENTIKNNLFLGNERGLYFCCGGRDNTVFNNVFMNNQYHVLGEQENMFDNGSIGNYWDDYNGIDADGDGIGDSVYRVIESNYGIENIDRFPLITVDRDL